MRLGLVPLLCFYHILTSTVIYLTNRFHVAVFSNRSQMTSKCGKNKEVAQSRRRVCQRVFHCPKPFFSSRKKKDKAKTIYNAIDWWWW